MHHCLYPRTGVPLEVANHYSTKDYTTLITFRYKRTIMIHEINHCTHTWLEGQLDYWCLCPLCWRPDMCSPLQYVEWHPEEPSCGHSGLLPPSRCDGSHDPEKESHTVLAGISRYKVSSHYCFMFSVWIRKQYTVKVVCNWNKL